MAEPARRIFHVAALDAWRAHAAEDARDWEPASLAREGFVHLSFVDQLAETLALHFAAEREVALLELDPARSGGELRLERSRGGALFPHLYRALRASDLRAVFTAARSEHGWELPAALQSEPTRGAAHRAP